MKTIPLKQAVGMIPDGASLMIGGFMGVGTPERLVDEIVLQGKAQSDRDRQRHGQAGHGHWQAGQRKLIRTAVVSHIGLNPKLRNKC